MTELYRCHSVPSFKEQATVVILAQLQPIMQRAALSAAIVTVLLLATKRETQV